MVRSRLNKCLFTRDISSLIRKTYTLHLGVACRMARKIQDCANNMINVQ